MQMKPVTSLIIAAFLALNWFAPAQAAERFYTATVHAAGPNPDGKIFILASDTANPPAFTKVWCVVLSTSAAGSQ